MVNKQIVFIPAFGYQEFLKKTVTTNKICTKKLRIIAHLVLVKLKRFIIFKLGFTG